MSMQDGQGLQDAGTANNNTDANTPTGNVDAGTVAPPVGENFQASNNPFLQAVDENDREIVAKYIDRWDANVTRRMQEAARQWEPYRNLGDVETLSKAQQLYDYFQRNPQEVYQKLHQAFGPQQQNQPLQPGLPYNGQGQVNYPEDLAPYFGQFDQRFQQFDQKFNQFQGTTTQILEALANYVTQQHQTSQQAQEDAALQQEIDLLHREFGDFDEEYVLTKIYTGQDPAAAVQAYRNSIQQQINQNRTPAPGPVLNGGGGAPPQGKSVTDLSQKETRSLVASVLEQAAKGQ